MPLLTALEAFLLPYTFQIVTKANTAVKTANKAVKRIISLVAKSIAISSIISPTSDIPLDKNSRNLPMIIFFLH